MTPPRFSIRSLARSLLDWSGLTAQSGSTSWLLPEGSRLVFVCILPFLPFMGAGIVRTTTGWSIKAGFCLALGVELVGIVALAALAKTGLPKQALLGSDRWLRRAALILAAGFAILAIKDLYNPALYGMPTYLGCDGGSHIGYRAQFVRTNPQEYAGFISLYSATYLLERIFGIRSFRSIEFAFYLSVFIATVTPVIVGSAALRGRAFSLRAKVIGLGAFAFAWCVALEGIVLPLLNNIEIDGFYAHFFSFLPLGLIWLLDVMIVPFVVRLLTLAMALALLRFTYGLNLPDTLVAVSVILLAEVLQARGKSRKALAFLAAIVLAVGAKVGYDALAPIFLLSGYVGTFDFKAIIDVVWLASGAIAIFLLVELMTTPSWDESSGWAGGTALVRAIRFPVLLALVSVLGLRHFLEHARSPYYPTKYSLVPLAWLSAAACVTIGYGAARIAEWKSSPWSSLLAIGAVASLGYLYTYPLTRVLEEAQSQFAERKGPPPFGRFRPLGDPEVWDRIDRVLGEERKSFGGLVSLDNPVAHFLNASLGHDGPAQIFVPPQTAPGYCAFWVHLDDEPGFTWSPTPQKVEEARQALEANPAKHCEVYPALWTPLPRSLCHACY
jgi:hypothetical protein